MGDIDSLLTAVAFILKEAIPQDVEKNMREQQLNLERFLLLDGDDLKELGFLLGPKKQLLRWINGQQTSTQEDSFTQSHITNIASPVASTSGIPRQLAATPSSSSTPSCVRRFKNCPVDEILAGKTTTKINGSTLVDRLKRGIMYDRSERMFLTKTLCRYLMSHCQTINDPTMEEKVDLAQSIVNTFPILKDPATGGYGEFCDPKSHSGYINYYIRTARSRSKDIVPRWKCQTKRKLDMSEEADDDIIRGLRERRPNTANRPELLELMEKVRPGRREWIESSHPSITEILRKYPRFQDIDDAIKEEYKAMKPNSKSLMDEFASIKRKILTVATSNSAASSFLEEVEDEADEDKKTEVAFKCLVAMLPAPPKRGVKVPKRSPASYVEHFFVNLKESTVEEAIESLRSSGHLQPCLFVAQGSYYLKADNTAIPLSSASCFGEAVELLFMSFWVFGVEYPAPLRLFYTFIENLMGVNNSNSPILRAFVRSLAAVE